MKGIIKNLKWVMESICIKNKGSILDSKYRENIYISDNKHIQI